MDDFLRNEYNRLSKKELKFPLIDEVKRLKDEALKQGSYEYYYLCDVLISDIYLDHNSYDEPLKILLADFKEIDHTLLKNVYISIIERLLYIYITKKNYRLALKYASLKEKYIDFNSIDAKCRWLLEMSYIYAEMNETSKAIECLKKIIENPTEVILPYALSNITKLYIDQKNIYAAENSLNECLKVTNDEEGIVYCDYLLAKVCVLKENYVEALSLYKHIFDNEDINQMTLPIVNEYLELLCNLKKYEEMSLVISKITLFINACDDLYIQKQFLRNKIRYLVGTKNVNELNNVIEDYEIIDQKIIDLEKRIALEANEMEKNDSIDEQVDNVLKDIDKIIYMLNNDSVYNSLRDLLLNFNVQIEKIIPCDDATFVLLNKPTNLDYLATENITCYDYKNNRLYEKAVTFDCLKNSAVEYTLNQNRKVAFDLSKNKIDILNIFNNRPYIVDKIQSVYAVPCSYQNDIFGIMIYSSYKKNLTDRNISILLDLATKNLESRLITYFTESILNITDKSLNGLVDRNNLGFVRICNDNLYLSNSLKESLSLKQNVISILNYTKLVSKSDIDRYQDAILENSYNINYKLNINNSVIPVTESVQSYYNNEGNVIFKYGLITVNKSEMKTIVDGKEELDKKIIELKNNSNRIEYRFSIIRIKCDYSNYNYIKSNFGVEPYFVDEDNYVIILENEVNIRTLEKLVNKIDGEYSIIRYPRDIVNIDEAFKLSKLMLENHIPVFTDDVYKEYLKKKSINTIATKSLNENTSITMSAVRYNGYDDEVWIEPRLVFNSNPSKDDIRNLLDEENLFKYDLKLYRSILDKNVNVKTIMFLNTKVIKKIIDESLLSNSFNNMYIVISEFNKNTNEIIERLARDVNVVVNCNIIKDISIYNFDFKLIKAIYLPKGVDEDMRRFVIRIAKMFNLEIISYYKMVDWNKNIYPNGTIEIIK